MGYMMCMEGVWGVHAHSAQVIVSLVVYSKIPPVCTYMYMYVYMCNTEMCTCLLYTSDAADE